MRAAVVGAGAVGSRAARQLASTDGLEHLVITDVDQERAQLVAASVGEGAVVAPGLGANLSGADVVVLTTPSGHRALAERALEQGAHVVSVVDDVDEVRALLPLDGEARERNLSVVIGAAFSPGLTCVLARHASSGFDSVEQVHVAKAGTGGPACARQHHRALATEVVDWRDGAWARRSGGSGRELCFFPDPLGAQDCYRAAVPDALLLTPAFGGVQRVTAGMAATRRAGLTSWLPMLRPPHPEGVIGGVRVEVRGRRGATQDIRVLGAIDRPAGAAGAVAAVGAGGAAGGRVGPSGGGGGGGGAGGGPAPPRGR